MSCSATSYRDPPSSHSFGNGSELPWTARPRRGRDADIDRQERWPVNVVVARHRRRRVWRRERASAFVATIVALSMVSVTLAPVVGAGAANIAPRLSPRVITKVPSSPCPWMGEARHHTQTATQMASQVVARMTSADLAHFVVLRAVAGVETSTSATRNSVFLR